MSNENTREMGNMNIDSLNGIDGIMSFLSLLSENGEAKIEVSFRIKGSGEPSSESVSRPKRPYDPEGRIAGIRGIAKHLGLGIASVQNMIKDGRIPVYRIGKRKMYAYDDEIIKSLATYGDEIGSPARNLLERRGYRKETVYKQATK